MRNLFKSRKRRMRPWGYTARVPAIVASDLFKVYKGFWGKHSQKALDGLNLNIPRGIAFGLIGQNGAGKTTFIKALLGVIQPTRGSVRVLGGLPKDRQVRSKIGYLPERLHLPHTWTPMEFLASVGRLKGLSALERDELSLRALLGRLGLGPDCTRKIGGFSKGMRQRLGLSAALLGKPELLVLDEPTDGIDPLGRAEIRRILMEERNRGTTVFLNSHLLSETEKICDRIGILNAGRVVREGTIESLCTSTTRYRLRFAPGFSMEALRASGFEPRMAEENASLMNEEPLEFECEAQDAAQLNAKLDEARRSGAQLIELSRQMRALEEVLSEAVGI